MAEWIRVLVGQTDAQGWHADPESGEERVFTDNVVYRSLLQDLTSPVTRVPADADAPAGIASRAKRRRLTVVVAVGPYVRGRAR